MSGKQISVVYFYLVSAGSLVLIVVGIFSLVNLLINLTQFDQYPLRYGVENCDSYPPKNAPAYPGAVDPRAPIPATPSAQEIEAAKKTCQDQAAFDRKQHKIDDIKSSVTFLLVGILLFLIHYPQARKQSK